MQASYPPAPTLGSRTRPGPSGACRRHLAITRQPHAETSHPPGRSIAGAAAASGVPGATKARYAGAETVAPA